MSGCWLALSTVIQQTNEPIATFSEYKASVIDITTCHYCWLLTIINFMCLVFRCQHLGAGGPLDTQKMPLMLAIAITVEWALIVEFLIVGSNDLLCLPRPFPLPLWFTRAHQHPPSRRRHLATPPPVRCLMCKFSNVQCLLGFHDALKAKVWHICAVVVLLKLEHWKIRLHREGTRKDGS